MLALGRFSDLYENCFSYDRGLSFAVSLKLLEITMVAGSFQRCCGPLSLKAVADH